MRVLAGCVIIVGFFLCSSAVAQSEDQLFESLIGHSQYTTETPAQIKIALLDSFLVLYPKTVHRAEAELEQAGCFQKLQQFEKAKAIYQRIMDQPPIAMASADIHHWSEYGGIVGVNARNYAAENMAELYYKLKEYRAALPFYKRALSYGFRSFSGTDINAFEVRLSRNMSHCYFLLGDIDSALSVLLPFMFNPVIYSERALAQSIGFIMSRPDKDRWCSVFDSALSATALTDSTMTFRLHSVPVTIPLYAFPDFIDPKDTVVRLVEPLASIPKTPAEAAAVFKSHAFYQIICTGEMPKRKK